MEAKVDRTYDAVADVKQMLAVTMQHFNIQYPPAGPQ